MLTKESVFEDLKKIAQDVTGNPQAFTDATPASDFRKDLGMDSISVLYMVLAIEKKFKIQFDNPSIEHLQNVGDVVSYVLGHAK
jgi:acyl carrier protein